MKKWNISQKRLLLYLLINFTLTYLLEFLVIAPAVTSASPAMQAASTLLVSSAMFLPAASVLLTRLLTREGFRDSCIVPKTGRRSIPYFLLGWFGPVLLTVLGAVVYFLVFPDHFDSSMGYLRTLLSASGMEAPKELAALTAVSQFATALLLGPLLNFIPCFGEEWGWRGYLLPKMLETRLYQKHGIVPVLLITGVIWGLWHAPITMLGHNYGIGYPGYPFTGILAMCLFCVTMGTLFSYVTLRTGSCLPAVLAHGSLNGFAQAPLLFTDGTSLNPFLGPVPTGLLGGCAFLVCAIISAVLLVKNPGHDRARILP